MNGYLSLAAKVHEELNISATIAPAGLAWQQIYKLQHSKDVAALPEGGANFQFA